MTKEDINSLWGVRDHLDEAFNRAGYDVCIVYQDFFQNDAVDVTDLRTKKIVTFELENYPEKARNDYQNLVRDICNVVFKQS